jgi:hypothetical protein
MKKLLIITFGFILFTLVFFMTGSWKVSLIAVPVVAAYLFWIIFVEGGWGRTPDKDELKKSINKLKKETENNPTLR